MSTKRRKHILIALLAVAALAALVGSYIYKYLTQPYAGDEVMLYVDARNGAEGLRDSLTTRLGDDYGAHVYNAWKRLSDNDELRSGAYCVKPGMKAYALARNIKNRRQDPVRVTFNNLRTLNQLADRMDSRLQLTADEFMAAADSILGARGVKKPNYVSYFLPDTYEFYWTDTPAKVVERLVATRDRFWNENRTRRAADLGFTPEQISVIASIAEEETNKADERGKVGRLYINRLHRDMMLQADPTVKFAVGDFTLRRILAKHLASPSPYNTYRHRGLPPGPIRMPAAATLDAVLNSKPHNYIYMCAKEDFSGYHNFAADYATHTENARRYRRALDARGIK